MTTLAKLGWGSEFHMGDVGGALAEIAEVISIQPPTHSADTVEATHMKSPARFHYNFPFPFYLSNVKQTLWPRSKHVV